MTGGPKKILVVEDQPLHMKLAVDLLQMNGYDVLQASSGKDALKLLKKEKVDLVLLDIGLPDGDGFEILKKIRATGGQKNKKVVALIPFSSPENQEKIAQAGFDGQLLKPLDIDQFSIFIKDLISRNSS